MEGQEDEDVEEEKECEKTLDDLEEWRSEKCWNMYCIAIEIAGVNHWQEPFNSGSKRICKHIRATTLFVFRTVYDQMHKPNDSLTWNKNNTFSLMECRNRRNCTRAHMQTPIRFLWSTVFNQMYLTIRLLATRTILAGLWQVYGVFWSPQIHTNTHAPRPRPRHAIVHLQQWQS